MFEWSMKFIDAMKRWRLMDDLHQLFFLDLNSMLSRFVDGSFTRQLETFKSFVEKDATPDFYSFSRPLHLSANGHLAAAFG
jgi:hypothetical protein